VSINEQKRVLADYFSEYMVLYTQLRDAETSEEMQRIEGEIERIRRELKERYPTILKGE